MPFPVGGNEANRHRIINLKNKIIMRKNYFLPQTEIIPHISVMECMQSTIVTLPNQDILPVDNGETTAP